MYRQPQEFFCYALAVESPIHEEQGDMVAVPCFKDPGKLRPFFGKQDDMCIAVAVSQRRRGGELEEFLDALGAVVRGHEFVEDPLDESADALLPPPHETVRSIHRMTSLC